MTTSSNYTLSYIAKHWHNKFIHYNERNLEELEITSENKKTLSALGLMNSEEFSKSSVIAFNRNLEYVKKHNDNYIKIANGLGFGLYLKRDNDHVYYLTESQNQNTENSLCNTTIKNYLIFETIKSKNHLEYREFDGDHLKSYIFARELIEDFKKIDPRAIYPYSYWSNNILNYAIDYLCTENSKLQAEIKETSFIPNEQIYYEALFHGADYLSKKCEHPTRKPYSDTMHL
ncbi:MAG: hypothetical protein KME20_12655 [Kaiparowitsia implicata GSE-PSE-MK54-09C]|nr:hypothetical protein [Kaiparowitsia implicata GSE-PSE-MK54-09C]